MVMTGLAAAAVRAIGTGPISDDASAGMDLPHHHAIVGGCRRKMVAEEEQFGRSSAPYGVIGFGSGKVKGREEMRQRVTVPIICYLVVGTALTVPAQLLGEAYQHVIPQESSAAEAREADAEEMLRLLERRRHRLRFANAARNPQIARPTIP
jgi:hypothetical protein